MHLDPRQSPPWHIVNTVCRFETGVRIQLIPALRALPDVPFNYAATHRSGLQLKSHFPYGTLMLHATGKVVISGTQSLEDARMIALRFCTLMTRHGIPMTVYNFTLKNMVATFSCDFIIDLALMVASLGSYAQFAPSTFRGAFVHLPPHTHVNITVFRGGQVCLQGARSEREVACMIRTVYVHLCRHRDRQLSAVRGDEYAADLRTNQSYNDPLLLRGASGAGARSVSAHGLAAAATIAVTMMPPGG